MVRTVNSAYSVIETQIALEAAFRVGDAHPDCSVFWVPAVDATSFENAYRAIGQQLKVPGIDEEKADSKALVKTALSCESTGSWLLVIDNADDIKLFGDTDLADYLPFNRKGSILFTTRNHEVAVELVEFERRIIPKGLKGDQIGDVASTDALLEFLCNLPLAIRQASAYMGKKQISTTQYLELCNSSDEDTIELLSRDFEDRHRYKDIQNPVATTWLISFQHISEHDPLAANYLRFMCFLAGKDIPQALLPPSGRLKTIDALGTLKAYAFISQHKESDTYNIHRLVQISMLSWLAQSGEQGEWAAKVLQRLADVFPSPKHENREEWIRYLPHTQRALELRKSIEDGDALIGLIFNVGEGLHQLGKYEDAERMHRQGLGLSEKVLGKEHPDTLTSMNSLANTLTSMNSLALVLESQGKYEEAERMHRQALGLREKELGLSEKVSGKEHPDTLTSMNNLASVLRRQGKYEEAKWC
ncbi:hypothetical protein N656DRAFT_839255 [Canariomyces notabilis]|uniref:NB-ARC domain-containing protein n=1 Tax=Canariomyces notabilis TaxID=2074819 RepID=A0AAN6TA01_9PEZI|nr:hypothetical protein N656DRAFT_839255 [Canariomyces arenarius]